MRAEKVALIEALAFGEIPPGPPIQELCDGSPFCRCKRPYTKGGTLLSQYKRGIRNKATRAANAAYIKEYRKRVGNGTS